MTKAAATSSSFFQSVLTWLRKCYPDGVPEPQFYPLLALLSRTLEEDDVVAATWTVLRESQPDSAATEDQIRQAVHAVIAKEPNSHEINQVAARLAVVGWPLAVGQG